MADTIWHEVTLDDGTTMYVNFDQVAAIAPRKDDRPGSLLIVAKGEYLIKESLADLQSVMPI